MTRFSLFCILMMCCIAGEAQASPETDFWAWFKKNESRLYHNERDHAKTFGSLSDAMHKVEPNLTFEVGPKYKGKRDFVISADGIYSAFPSVESLYASAPKLARWKFIKFRQRHEPTDISYRGVSVKADAVLIFIEPDGERVGITMLIPGYTDAEYNTYAAIAFLYLDEALGEYDVETRVGVISILAPTGDEKNTHPIRELASQVDAFFAPH